MSLTNDKPAYHLLWIVFIIFAIQTVQVISALSEVPPPPTRPERFHSREELKRYLQLVHEYYAIIGRPRFGRSVLRSLIDPTDVNLFNSFDTNADKSISYDEFHRRLGA